MIAKQHRLTPEDLRFNPPEFDKPVLADFALHAFGISGELKSLRGERDQNHWLTTADGRDFVLKVSGLNEDASIVDFQAKALQHIERVAPDLNIPRTVPALDGNPIAQLSDEQGREHRVRLLTFVPGGAFCAKAPPPKGVMYALGSFQGQLCRALENFEHPAAMQFMPWDISNGLVLSESLSQAKYEDVSRLVIPLLDHFEHNVLPAMKSLRHQVIHNDGHTGNLLSSSEGADDFVGLIDFGDMVHAPMIDDLAVSLDSLMPRCGEDAVESAAMLISGFHEQFPLQEEEIEILFDLCTLRGALTIQLYDFVLRHPETVRDDLIAEYPAVVRDFEHNQQIDRDRATALWRKTCAL